MNLRDRSVVITGATGGLGRAVAHAVGAAGAAVFPVWMDPEDEATALGLAANGGLAVQADVSERESVARMVERVVAAGGRLDGLVNLVGGFDGGNPVAELDPDRFVRQLQLNLVTAALACGAALPVMLGQGRGRIVNVSSRVALRPGAGQAGYNASKAGVLSLTETIAEETAGTGVTANAIVPSIIDTPANRASMPTADFSKWPKPVDLAPVVVFLLTDESAVVNGAAIPVFGAAR
jgi:NAD(P)-dependent dehydrogenase (short-subunit alcohol dehydrogenase family)